MLFGTHADGWKDIGWVHPYKFFIRKSVGEAALLCCATSEGITDRFEYIKIFSYFFK